jgi:predicted membrane GTPase involved in stress response
MPQARFVTRKALALARRLFTPKSIRLRKRYLKEHERKRASRQM